MEAAKNIKSATAFNSRLIAAALISGALYGLSFPPFNLSLFAWIALVPVLLCADARPRGNFLLGWAAGFVAHLFVFAWIWKTFAAAHVGFGIALACWIALAALTGLYEGVFLAAFGLFRSHRWRAVMAGLVWVGLEIIRSHVMTGFPWALLGHTRAYDIRLIQIAHWTGAEGLSFIIVFVNVALSQALLARKNRWQPLTAAAALVAVVVGIGAWQLSKADTNVGARKIRVAILQGNIDQYQKWDDQYEASIRSTYENLAVQAAAEKPDIIIWPESAVPGWFPNQEQYRMWVSSVARASRAYNIVGAVTSHDHKEYNAAFLIGPDGKTLAEYDKQHMVPFGEYIPFGNFFARWIPYLGQLGAFDAGDSAVIFKIDGIRFSPNICYEAMFSSLVKHSLAPGADAIVNITNDGWFLDTGAPEQHYVANIFRAVENRTPVIRAANTGISAIIDAYGRQQLRSPLLKQGVFRGEIQKKAP